VDQAHEQVAHLGAAQGFVEQRILTVQDGALQRAFAEIDGSVLRMVPFTPRTEKSLKPDYTRDDLFTPGLFGLFKIDYNHRDVIGLPWRLVPPRPGEHLF
jgi:hypothetical protein